MSCLVQQKNHQNTFKGLKILLADRDAYIALLEERIRILNMCIFGPKSEKKHQARLVQTFWRGGHARTRAGQG